MEHRDSSATLGGASAFRSSGGGIGAPAAQHCPEDGPDTAAKLTDSRNLGRTARALLLAVHIYQSFFSAIMPSACKFYPSCSHYAAEALRLHGARRGTWLAIRRISRCHPFTRGGVDLVPDRSVASPTVNAANPMQLPDNTQSEVRS
jgi:putative membrane protein insertion efficiency factor